MTSSLFPWIVLAGSIGLLAYCHVGYPVVLAVLAPLAPRRDPAAGALPSVALIISAFDEREVIEAKIRNALELDYPAASRRIIVVADGSTDDTAEIAGRFVAQGVVVLADPERRGKSAAMTRGAGAADAEVLVFSDANAFYRRDALRMLVRQFGDPAVGLVSGRKIVSRAGLALESSERLYWNYESFIRARESALGSTTGVVGEILAIRCALFEPIPPEIIQDDAYLALSVLRQGARVAFEPAAVSVETGALSLHDEFVRRTRISAGRWQLAAAPSLWPWNRPFALFALLSHKYLRLAVPFLLAAALASSCLLAFIDDVAGLRVFVAAQLVGYTVAAAALASEGVQRIRVARTLGYMLAGHLATATGFLRYLAGGQTPLWTTVRRGTPIPTQ